MFLLCSCPSLLTEGVSGDEPLAERGMRRLHPGFVSPDQEARSLPDPDEGSALDGWTGLDERRRKCRPDNVSGSRSGPGQEVRRPCKKSPQWSAGRRACSIARARGASHEVPHVTQRLPGAPPPP